MDGISINVNLLKHIAIVNQRLKKIDNGSKETNYYYQNGEVMYTEDGTEKKTAFNLMGASDNVISSLRYDVRYEFDINQGSY